MLDFLLIELIAALIGLVGIGLQTLGSLVLIIALMINMFR